MKGTDFKIILLAVDVLGSVKMASPATDNIRVAIRVRPFIKRESDLQTHWKVDRNTMTQVSHGKLMSNSSYSFDRIFDVSNSTQDVYDDYGRPTVLSAMDGFNGTLFAYGQTSSGKTHTMMGDQRNEGVIPKAVGEIYDYIEKHPSREFLIRVSYMEIYNEDIQDLLNPAKTNLKIHENPQKQVYVGELTEEVVSCGEDVFKHMLRGEKNRHFAETNMNDRSSRSHTIFRVVIESREMMGEGKDADAIDGAVRVAHLNLVDLAGSERASQTGAVGQRLKEGGHINKSLLTLGTVIAKLSEGESFIPFRDSKLTRILQSSLGGNAKTSMICTITPAAVEETISTLKFACRAKTIKNCPEVNEVLDDGTLLKRYRKEICQLKKKLDEIGQQSTISQMQELQVEKEKMVEMLEQQRKQQSEQEDKIKRLRDMICSAGGVNQTKVNKARMSKRRETWCPGAALSKTPLASATALGNAFQTRLQRIGSSPSSEESEFDEMPRGAFLSILEEEEERKSIEFSQKRVGFVSPQIKRCLSPVMDTELEDKDMQTEPDEKMIKLQNEVKNLRKDLDEAVQTRDLYNELLEESNNLLEKKMSTESGFCPAPTSSDITLRYVTEIRNIRNEKANLETQVEVLRTQCQDLEELKTRNKELEDQVQSLESERTLSDEYASELQTEYESVQAEKQALAARVEGLENTSAFNTAAKMQLDSLQMTFEESEREKQQLQENLESWKQTCASLEGEVTRLQNELGCAANHKDTEALMALEESDREKQRLQENLESWKEKYASLEGEVTRLQNELSCTADEKDAEALVSAAKVEIDSLQMVLEENIREKEQLQENLESWKEKYASLEGEVTRLQNELSCTADEKDAEALVSAAKVEIDSLHMVLEENVREKEQLQEHLESWKEKYASLEGEVTRLQNELSCTADEKDAEALVSAAKVEIDSLQMVLEENVREKEQLQEHLESWKEKYASLEGEVTRLQNELGCTADERDAEALVSAAEVEIDSLQMVLEENVREKQQLQENLESWKEKYGSLEGEVARLQNELSCTADEKDAEALVSAAKVEIDSLQMVLEENVREKEQLQEHLESWKEKYASLEGEVTRLQNELSCTADEKDAEALVSAAKVEIDSLQMVLEENVREKQQLQENLESWKEKYGSLEGEVARLQNELSCTADEKDAEALVSAAKVEIDSLQMVLEENVREKEQLQEHLESWKEKYASLEGEVTRLQNELSCTADEKDAEALVSAAKVEIDSLQMVLEENVREKQQLQKNLESWKEKYASLEGEVTRLQNELSCTVDKKDAEALVSAAKVEIDSLQMVLEENVREKEQLQEHLESWKEKYGSLEGEVTRLQNELSCTADEKDAEALVSAAKVEIDSLQMVLEENVREKEQLQEHLESWKEKYASLEGEVTRLQNELSCTADEKDAEALVSAAKVEIDSLQMVLEENVREKQQLQEHLESWKEKYASLEGEVTRLQNELSCTADEKDAEALISAAKVEIDSLQMVLEENVREKEQLQENLESWKEKFSCLERDVAQLQDELTCAAAEKIQWEERMVCVKEDASVKAKELEDEIKRMEERLSSADEQEQMLTDVIEQKLQLEENIELLKAEQKKEISEEKCDIETRFEQFKAGKETEIAELLTKLEKVKQQLEEKPCEVQKKDAMVAQVIADERENLLNEVSQQKRAVEESFGVFKEEKETEIAKLMEEIKLLQTKLNEKTLSLKEKEKLLNDAVQQTCEFDTFKLEKETEVQKLSEGLRELEVHLHEKTNTVEEKENLLNEMIQLKCETEEKWKMFRQDKESEIERLTQQLHKNVTREDDLNQSLDSEDKQVMLLKAKVSDLKVQLEKTIDEKKELEHMLDRVKKERDEIKNDLSESITDTAELQKDVFDMQQKVKQYKEYIYELESELEQRVATIATCEQKIEYLQHQCTHKLTNEDLSEQNDDLASLQKDPAQEIAVECSALKSSLETAERANELLENEAQKIRHEADQLRGKVEDLEEQLVESEQACAISEQRLQVEQENCEKLIKEFDEYRLTDCRACKDLENQLAEIKQAGNVAAKQYEEERAKCTKLEIELEQLKSNVCRTKDSSGSVPFELELQKAKKESEELVKYFTDEKKAHEMLRKEHSSLSEELQYLRDSLLRDTNRGMDQQRVIDKMKTERRETICVQAHQRQELEKDLCEAEKKVTELESHCTLLKSGKDVLEHRLEVANKKLEETKQEMRDTENLFSSHNTRAVTQLDDNKALQKLKQMAFSVDLTKQKCEKAEARVKELENENRQLRGAEIRNGALLEERDNLKQQVQQAKQALDEKSRKLNQFSIEVTQLRAHVDKLSEENKKNRSSLEKKEDKIDNLEQKLWDTEEELKLERQRFHEQQSRGPILEELNSTIQVKHEELEHMTFLVDEKDIEIAEVRCSLQENETKQEEMVGTLQRKEERLDELENELEHANKNTLVARAGCEEAEVKIEELKAIIKQQESEMILINEKIESGKTESEIQSQELGSKTQLLENELQDMEHKLLEVESELEFTKTSCEKATAEKQELVDVLGAYGEAFNNNSSAEDLNVDVEFLKAQLGPNLEQISSVLNRTNEVENINNKLKEALEGRVLLEEKLAELQTSFKGEQSALEEEIDELRESVLNEKKLVFELEDKVNIAVNGKNAMEAELRRVLLEKEASVAKDDVDMKIAAIANSESEMRRDLEEAKERVMQFEGEIARLTEEKDKWENILTSETELRRQLETQKELNIQLEDEARKLKEEIATWESQAETKSMVPEENPWEEEMARITERYEEEKQQLLDQLREISALKVKESEDIYSEKEEKIEELESKLATVTKTAVDYERAVEHYQLKLAKVEYELDTTVERLEKQSSTSTVDNREMETLKKECEVAKKNCKDAQEKYFSESDRLKAIIDEQEDELDALKAELKKMSEASQNPVANSEMESLRKECEVAKKRCKEAQEKYFSESDRLKAIIDEQEDELDALKAELKKTSEASQNSSKPVANSEMESLRKECEVAKKQCKDAQEKYFSESDRLKAIIDEQEDELDALKAELKKMSEASQNSSNAVANSEMESLRKECEVAKKRCKEAQEKYFSESDRLKAIIDEMQDEQEEYVRQMNELKTKTVQKEAEMCQMRNELAEMKRKAQGATKSTSYTENSEMETLKKECEVAKRKCKEAQEKYFSESDRLKAIIDEQEGELDAVKAELKKMSEASQNSSNPVANSEMESLRKECEVAKKRCKEAQEKYFSESDRLKAIIDEMQDEQEEYVRQMNELKTKTAQKEAEMCQIRNQLAEMKRKAQGATVQNGACSVDSMECLKRKFEAANKKAEEKYASESDRLKAIIHEQQEIIEKSRNEEDTDEELKTTRIDLAQKNMQIQSLQYDLYKLQENYNKDTRALSKEVEWGRDKVGSLKIEIRRLKENEPEDTISFIRGQPVAAKKKESSDVGVVSTVAIYSLKAKVGKLESETERLNEKVQQLQKEKATFSLLNTEASNKVAQLTSENKALKTHKKKLMEEAQKLKANEGDSKPKVDSGRRLPEVSTEALERESRNSTILSLSCVENVSLPTAEYKRSKPESKPKQNFQNWLSEDAADNMFKDEPNQCANQ